MRISSASLVVAALLFAAAPAAAQNSLPFPSVDWNGVYLGALTGAAVGHFDVTSSGENPDPESDEISYGDFDFDDVSWLAGGQIGFDHQTGNFVFGAVGDFMATNLQGGDHFSVSVESPNEMLAFDNYSGDIAASLDWLATFRAKAGFTRGPFLLYVTGGLALGDLGVAVGINEDESGGGCEGQQICCDDNECPAIAAFDATPDLPGSPDSYDFYGSGNKVVPGIALGAGAAVHITPNLVAELSYLYVNLDNTHFHLDLLGDEESDRGNANVDFDAHLARFALSYHF